MKKFLTLLVATLLGSPAALAGGGNCETLFSQIDAWLAGNNRYVRMVTTFSGSGNSVSYTRGFLEPSENAAGTYDVDSAVYNNESNDAVSPFQRVDDELIIKLRKTANDAATLTFTRAGQPGTSFPVQCRDGIMASINGLGVLTASFRFSASN